MDYQNILSRAAWTFAQAFLAVFAVLDWQLTWKPALAAGFAAALSFVKTVIVEKIEAAHPSY